MEWLQSRLAAGPCPQSVLVAEAESAGLSIISAALALQVDVYDADGVPTCRLLPNRPAAENTDFAFGHNSPGQLFDNGNGRVD